MTHSPSVQLRDPSAFAPTFDHSLPRSLVHKAGPEAVWATELTRLDEDRYLCAGHVPRAHSLLGDQLGPRYDYYDLAFLAEMGRQAGISALHRYLDVPTSHATVFMKLRVTVESRSRTTAPRCRRRCWCRWSSPTASTTTAW